MYGTEVRALEILRAYVERGVRVTLATTLGQRDLVSVNANANDYHFFPIYGSSTFRLIGSYLMLPLRVLWLVARVGEYDVLIVCTKSFSELLSAFLASKLCRIPYVVTLHHVQEEDWISLSQLFREYRGAYKKSLFTSAILAITNFLSRKFIAGADLLFAVSYNSKTQFSKLSQLAASRIEVTYNGIDSQFFVEKQSADSEFDAMFVGRPSKNKGIDTLLYCWKIVSQSIPEAKLAIVGGSVDALNEWKRMAEQLRIMKNVQFLGYVDKPVLLRLLGASTLFVFPSRREGFAIAVAEAMASGLPCVISDIPVFQELYGEAAVLAESGSPEDFARKILWLLLDQAAREKYSKLSLGLSAKFSWRAVAEREVLLIKNLCQSSSEDYPSISRRA